MSKYPIRQRQIVLVNQRRDDNLLFNVGPLSVVLPHNSVDILFLGVQPGS